MDSTDLDHQVPSARVVREAGAVVATPRRPLGEHVRRTFAPLGARAAVHGRGVLVVLVGLWPLTAIVAVASALIWAAGYGNSP